MAPTLVRVRKRVGALALDGDNHTNFAAEPTLGEHEHRRLLALALPGPDWTLHEIVLAF